MTIVQSINQLFGFIGAAFRQIGRGRIWLVLLIYYAFLWFCLFAHHQFSSAVFQGPVMWWLGLVNESAAELFTRYPGHYLLLPYFFGWAKVVAGLVFEGLVFGIVAVMFANRYQGRAGRDRAGSSVAIRKWPLLVLIWAFVNGLMLVLNMHLPDMLQFLHNDSPRRLFAVHLVIMPFCYSIVVALFFTAIPRLTAGGEGIVTGVVGSLRLFLRRPFTSLILALLVVMPPAMVSAVANESAMVVDKFRPELVYWLLVAGLVAEMIGAFFYMALATRFMLEPEEHI